jgi:3-phenylpropionate/trans-cinnamate dioxygenase ferredoxin reductase subunit
VTTFVIVGAGLAGAKAAQTLREQGFDGRLVLVGDEHELPYERPPLSKQYLSGEAPRDGAHVHAREFYAEQEIELAAGVAVSALDPGDHRVTLADGRAMSYDRLLIATGSVPRRPPIPGIELAGAHTLRTLPDADALRRGIGSGTRVAIIGSGWIGCEVAASARTLGADVTLIGRSETPLEAVLGRELGALFAGLHRGHGVRVLTGAEVAAIEGAERAERVRLADGSAIECDLVVIGVGVTPDTRLASDAGLESDDGIVADAHLRTSAPGVFAAGDVASAFHPRYRRRLRVEHWANALNQGVAVAHSMLGDDRPYSRLPYFFSDQYELGMEYIGLHAPTDRLVLRGEPESLELHAFWLDAGSRITAGMHLNRWDTIEPIERLIEGGVVVDAARLADAGVPLDAVADAAVSG